MVVVVRAVAVTCCFCVCYSHMFLHVVDVLCVRSRCYSHVLCVCLCEPFGGIVFEHIIVVNSSSEVV